MIRYLLAVAFAAATSLTYGETEIVPPSSGGVTGITFTAPNVLYTTPVTFTPTGTDWAGALSFVPQNANTVLAGPTSGGAATPTVRGLVVDDIPSGIARTAIDNSFTAAQTLTIAPAANTAITGWLLTNTTPATSGNQQFSPATHWRGQGWKTTATAASQSVEFRAYVVPVQGSTNPTGRLLFDASVNGAAFTAAMALNSTNTGSLRLTVESILGTGMNTDGSGAGNPYYNLNSGGLALADGGVVSFSSNASATSTRDTGIRRNSAGVLEVNNGTLGTFRDLLARGLRSNPVTFANAITSPATGTVQAFSDSTTATWGDVITGGGSNVVLGFFNGANWTVFAK